MQSYYLLITSELVQKLSLISFEKSGWFAPHAYTKDFEMHIKVLMPPVYLKSVPTHKLVHQLGQLFCAFDINSQ